MLDVIPQLVVINSKCPPTSSLSWKSLQTPSDCPSCSQVPALL